MVTDELEISQLQQSELFKPTSNVTFNPLPTTSGKCSKLKISVILDATHYVAGGTLNGRFELLSTTNQDLWLGDICVQFTGFEQVQTSKFENSQTFLSAKMVYQGDRHRPSDAVRGPCVDGYYLANKGKTIFPFQFEIPEDAPASFEFQTLAKLKYTVTGHVRFRYGGTTDTLIKSKEARILDQWNIEKELQTAKPIVLSNERKLFMGGDGVVQLEAQIKSNFVTSGTNMSVHVKVKNETRKRVQGLKIAFLRRLLMLCPPEDPADTETQVKVIEEITSSHAYKEKDFIFDPDEERSSTIHVPIPVKAHTVQNTSLAEISYYLAVSLGMPGLLSKDLLVELPLRICHPVSFEAPTTNHNEPSKKEEQAPRLSRDIFTELDFGNRGIPLTQSIELPKTLPKTATVTVEQLDPVPEVVTPDQFVTEPFSRENHMPAQESMYITAQDRHQISHRTSLDVRRSHDSKPSTLIRTRRSRDSKARPLPEIPAENQVATLGYYFGKAMDLFEYATNPLYERQPTVTAELANKGVHLSESDGDSEQFVRKNNMVVVEPTRMLRKENKKKRRSMRQPKPLPQPKEPPTLKLGKKPITSIVDDDEVKTFTVRKVKMIEDTSDEDFIW